MDFGGPLLVFEVAGLCGKSVVGRAKPPGRVDNEFYLEEGAIKRGKFYPKGSDEGESLADVDYHVEPGSIFQNFIDCVRSRDHTKLQADILQAHLSAALCHLGNISYRLGQQVPGTTEPDVLGAHEEVRRSWNDMQEGLNNAIGLDLPKSTFQLGSMLRFDPENEKFIGNAEADKLLTRNYREPFVVTEEV